MNVAEIFDQINHVINKVQACMNDISVAEKHAIVEVSNRKRKLLGPLNPFKPDFTLNSNRDVTMCIITLILVGMIDRRIFPLFFKVWLIFTLYLLYLLWNDWMRIPVIYKIPSRMSNAPHKTAVDSVNALRRSLEEVPTIAINQCTFQISAVKILETTTGPSDSTAVNINSINGDLESQALFQIVVTHASHRWSVWRKYEDFYETYLALHDKYVGTHQAIRYTKLHSLRRLKKLHKKDNYQGLASTNNSMWGMGEMESTSANDVRDDSKEFIEMPFLQKLQYEMISWLKVVQTDLVLGEDDLIAALLKFPSYEAAQKLKILEETSAAGGSCNRTLQNYLTAKHHKDLLNGVDTAYYSADGKLHSVATVATAATAAGAVAHTDATALDSIAEVVQEVVEGEEEEAEVVSADGTWKGTGVHNFQFLDLSPAQKALYADCSYNNNFKVRGLHYASDKKKVDAGAPISKFICEEIFKVDITKYGDQLDHIARLGNVKRRVNILANLPDKPFVYVLNIQLPGVPPVSCVFYFVIPVNSADWKSKENTKVRKLFEQFIDIPFTSEEGEDDNAVGGDGGETANSATKDAIAGASANADAEVEAFEDAMEMPPNHLSSKSGDGTQSPPRASSPTDSVDSDTTRVTPTAKRSATSAAPFSSPAPAPAVPPTPAAPKPTLHKQTSASFVTSAPAATAKSWTSDIVWPAVGEPGIFDRKSFQNLRFKLIPNMVEAPWVVQMAVPPTPVILGQKIVLRHFRGRNYMETDMHVGSSNIANNIVGLCRVYAKAFVCNIGVVLQGENEDELPEKLLACATMVRTDLDIDAKLDC